MSKIISKNLYFIRFLFEFLLFYLCINLFLTTLNLFKSMKKYFTHLKHLKSWTLVMSLTFLAWQGVYAQQLQYVITGRITDQATGESLAGATVNIENTGFATATDIEGNFTLTAKLAPGSYKVISRLVGYSRMTQTVELGNQSNVSLDIISLNEDLMKLDEVVVIGPSMVSERKTLGNSIGSIDAGQIKDLASPNPLSALSGRTPGAIVTQNSGDPGGGFSVFLRGPSSIKGGSQPLFIVDGVIASNSSENVINRNADAMGTSFAAGQNRMVDINPADIEHIEVINGGAAAAIYGSLASNGVVLITTKRGSQGKPRITVSSSFSVSELRKRLEFNDYPFRFGIPGDERLSTVGDRLTMIADLRPNGVANPGTGPASLGGPLVEDQYAVTRYDYQDNLFRTAIGTENFVSITGGNDQTSYYGSVSYTNNEGILLNTNFQRYGARFRLDQKFGTKAKISTGLNYTNSSSKDMPNGNNFFSPISTMIIIDNVWDITERDASGNLLHVEQQRVNPLSVLETFDITQETNRLIGDVKASFYPLDGLAIDYTIGLDTYGLLGNTFQPRLPYGPVAAAFFPDGYAAVATSNFFAVNHDWVASYQKNINENISSTTTLGAQLIYRKQSFTSIEGRDLQPFIQTIGAARNFFTPAIESRNEVSIWGYFLQQTFGYKDYLFLTLAGRIDGSSLFGQEQRNQFYPKVGLSFVLSDLDFWKNGGLGNAWNTMKFRASYGESGNLTGIGAFDRFTNASAVLLPVGNGGGFVPNARLGQSDISPERNKEFEFGVDMSFLKNRLGVQFTYYKQQIDDLILDRTLSPSEGGSQIVQNAGSMQNSGIELMITASPIRTSDFRWETTFSFNTYKNRVTRLINSGRVGILLRGGGGTQSAVEGHPLGVFVANYYARNTDGSLLLSPIGLPQIERGNDATGEILRNQSGQPTGDPLRKILGSPLPTYNAAFINEFSYKKFSLRVQFDALGGFQVYNWNKLTSNNVGASPLSERELRGELPRGWNAAVGGFIGPRIQEEHIEDGDFIKLREIAFTYNVGKFSGFENLDISLVGRNIFSIDNYTGFDPETNSAGQADNVRGDDFGNVPIPRLYQLKITASF
jgi:TonB-linked SusC/RagA family outer membrane protein